MNLTIEDMIEFIKSCDPLETDKEIEMMDYDEIAELYEEYRCARCADDFDRQYHLLPWDPY